ncbi:restriction endonuclease subunit S [Companilactobacillus huachuanensis]|uniref:Restriction endonuclease subunit S n=1 Tax=Companilactobacillus huachuanensis TaxID=2559914 RepID=A0ABW1RKT2_9LACO|nr:restriction endonuclease subunit S [Companilactobacillus huachuanensis]
MSKTSDNPNLPRIEYEDVISGEGQLKQKFYNKKNLKKGIEFEPNDILFGKLRPYLKNWIFAIFKGIAVGDWWVLRPINYNNRFVYYLIQTSRYQTAANLSTGTKMPRSDWKVVSQTIFYTPNNIQEQGHLAQVLISLESLIKLYQEKLTLYESMKKGMIQNIFPANDNATPNLRRNEFSEDWTQYNLGDLANIVRGASPRPIKDKKWFDEDSDVGWLRISDVTQQEGRIRYLEQHISKLGQNKTRVLTEPHILLSIAASVGKPVINYVKTGVHDGFLIFLNPKFKIEFMFQWLEMFQSSWRHYGQPGSQVNLNSDLVKNQRINLPNVEEQKEIGDFLLEIDNSINIQRKKIKNLQATKKYLLQKLFI